MLNKTLAAVLLVTVALPAAASASTRCREARHDQQVTGTVIGAVAGGLLGNAVSHGGGRAGGTILGAVGGAVIGNQLASSSGRACPDGYEAYDDGVRTEVAPSAAYPDPYPAPSQGPYRRQDVQGPEMRQDEMHRDQMRPDEHDGRDPERRDFDREWGSRGADWDHSWRRGEYLPANYATDPRYVVRDYRAYNLDRPRRGYHWSRYGRAFVLVRQDGFVGRYVRNDRY
jgi:Ni/Co efflux regulator RcnB